MLRFKVCTELYSDGNNEAAIADSSCVNEYNFICKVELPATTSAAPTTTTAPPATTRNPKLEELDRQLAEMAEQLVKGNASVDTLKDSIGIEPHPRLYNCPNTSYDREAPEDARMF